MPLYNQWVYYLLSIIICVIVSACAKPHELYQYSTLNALMEGVYDGQLSVGELKSHGDTGLGTFNGLDGEMIVVDGDIYQITGDGIVHAVSDNVKTPFAAVTFFKSSMSFDMEREISCDDLEKRILQGVPSPNIIYAVKIEGRFKHIQARAVKAQHKPYPRLIEAAKEQGLFDFDDIEGVMSGFFIPESFGGLNVGGFHVHFLSSDRKSGGHLMSCVISRAAVNIDYLTDFVLELPKSGGIYDKSLGAVQKREVDSIEKGR